MITKRVIALLLFAAMLASLLVVNVSAFPDESGDIYDDIYSEDGYITIDENTDLEALGLQDAIVFEKDAEDSSSDTSAEENSGEASGSTDAPTPNVMVSEPVVSVPFADSELDPMGGTTAPFLDSSVGEESSEGYSEEISEHTEESENGEETSEYTEEISENTEEISVEASEEDSTVPAAPKNPAPITPEGVIDREYETKDELTLNPTSTDSGNPTQYRTYNNNDAYDNMTAIKESTIQSGRYGNIRLSNVVTMKGTVTIYGTLQVVIVIQGNWSLANPCKTGFVRGDGFTGPFFNIKNGGRLEIYGVTNNTSKKNDNNNYIYFDGLSNKATDSMIVMESGSSCLMQGGRVQNGIITDANGNLDGNGGAIRMSGGTLRLEDFRSENCKAGNGGTIYASGSSVIEIYDKTNDTVNNDSWLSKGGANNGGAICLEGSANMTIDNPYFTIGASSTADSAYKNTAINGGAVYINGGTLTVKSTSSFGFGCNEATSNGGAVFLNSGTLNFNGGNIKNNEATKGGGIYVESGTLTISNGTVEGNVAFEKGGALYVKSGDVSLKSGGLKNNYAAIVTNTQVLDNIAPKAQYKGTGVVNGAGYQDTSTWTTYHAGKLNDGVYPNKTSNTYSGNGPHDIVEFWIKDFQTGDLYVWFDFGKTVSIQSVTAYMKARSDTRGFPSNFKVYVGDNGTTATSNTSLGAYSAVADGTIKKYTVSSGSALSGRYVVLVFTVPSYAKSVLSCGEIEIFGYTDGTGYDSSSPDLLGGGAYIESGTFKVEGGEISGNQAGKGGGIYQENGTVTVSSGKVGVSGSPNKAIDGGGIYLQNGTLTLSGGNVQYNKAGHSAFVASGGGIAVYGGTLDLNGGNINHNEADNNGGGVAIYDGTFNVKNGKINNNTYLHPDYYGAGIYMEGENTVLNITGGSIESNTSKKSGGGIAAFNGTLNFSGGTVYKNTCTESGAGIFLSTTVSDGNTENAENSGVRFTMSGTAKIDDNENTGGNGGGIWVGSINSFTMSGGTISNNDTTASDSSGGGIFFNRMVKNPIVISGGTINNNTTKNRGGGIYFGAGEESDMTLTATISNCTISSNTAANGGGIYVNESTYKVQVTFASGNVLKSNTATYGGGVYVNKGKFIMTGGSIEANVNSTNGAGVYIASADAVFDFSSGSVKSNTASEYGGALYLNGGVATVSGNALMDSNKAVSGGAVYVNSTAIFHLTGGTISKNETKTHDSLSKNGAGVFSKGEFYMSNGAISANTSVSSGGGVCIDGGRFEFSGGSISENVCSGSGAGIYLRENTGTVFIMSDPEEEGEQVQTVINGNINNSGNGGGIWVGSITRFTITGGTISNNVLLQSGNKNGGGIFFNRMLQNPAEISGGTISGNNATWGGGIYVGDGTTAGVAGKLVVNISGDTIIKDNICKYSATSGNGLYGGAGIGVDGTGDNFENQIKYYDVEVNISENVQISHNTIEGSTGPTYVGGGGVFVCGQWASVNFSGGSISGNETNKSGGGVSVRGGSIFSMSGGSISGNEAVNYGGGIIVGVHAYEPVGGIFNMTGGTVSDNFAAKGGGGVFADDHTTVNICGDANSENKPQFTDNHTNEDGGGIYFDGNHGTNGDATIKNTVLKNNVAKRYGGGIFLYNTDSPKFSTDYGVLDFTGCIFEGCVSEGSTYGTSSSPNMGGGGLCVEEGVTINKLDLSGSLFKDCSAVYFGGGISIKCNNVGTKLVKIGELVLDNCCFDHCTVKGADVSSGYPGNGGAIFLSGKIDKISYVCDVEKDCYVQNCEANAGSAILFGEKNYSETDIGEFKVENVTFRDNSSPATLADGSPPPDGSYGSVIKTEGETAVIMNVTACDFINNHNRSTDGAAHGGAFYWNSGQKTVQNSQMAKLTVKDCRFLGNSTTWHGGAIYNEAVLEVISCEFAGNRAGDYGGAIAVRNYGLNTQTPPSRLELNLGEGTSLHHNYSEEFGGAISMLGASTSVTPPSNNVFFGLIIDGAEIYDNVAKENGGAIYFHAQKNCDDYLNYSTAVDIRNGSLCGNRAGYTATAANNGLYYADQEVNQGMGGAIYMDTEDDRAFGVSISGGTIGGKARSADSGGNYAYYGGGICVESNLITIDFNGGHFINNQAHYGGALYANASQVNISGGANVFQNIAANGGGVAAVDGASVKMTGGYLCYNTATGVPESGINTSYKKHGDLVGVGGGIYLADGVSASDRTTFELAPINTSADVDSLGIYGNIADFSADDIFANGTYTQFIVPRALSMDFDAFEGNNRLRAVGWFEDYNIGDASYTSGLNGLGASNGDSVVRYRGNPQPVIAFVDSADAQMAGISRSKFIKDVDTYICLTLATAKINSGKLTIIKSGTGIDPEQVFVYNVNGITEDGNQVSFSVQIRGTGNVMIDNLPDGTYTVAELKSWSWRYEVTDIVYNESTVTVTEDFVCSFVISFNNATPTVVFTNAKVEEKWLNHVSDVKKNTAKPAIYLSDWGNASYNNNNITKIVSPITIYPKAVNFNSNANAVFDFNIRCVNAREYVYFPIKGLTVGQTYRITFKERYDGVPNGSNHFVDSDTYTYGCSVFVDFPTTDLYKEEFWETTGTAPELWYTTEIGEQTGYVEFVAESPTMYWVWNLGDVVDAPANHITFTVTGFECLSTPVS